MINWINGHAGKRFKAMVYHCGIFDTRSFYYSTEELWFPEWDFGGSPLTAEGRKMYDKWNPSLFVDKWETPTLVIQGGKDFRCVESEGIATFTALQRQGIPSRFVYFPDEGHFVAKGKNSLRWHREVLRWLEEMV
jgi:dipeptidyl aminopeptidase/acylaminoacyl peptidase